VLTLDVLCSWLYRYVSHKYINMWRCDDDSFRQERPKLISHDVQIREVNSNFLMLAFCLSGRAEWKHAVSCGTVRSVCWHVPCYDFVFLLWRHVAFYGWTVIYTASGLGYAQYLVRFLKWGVRHCETMWGIVRHCEPLWNIVRQCEALWDIMRHCETFYRSRRCRWGQQFIEKLVEKWNCKGEGNKGTVAL
jgi:hypothetical protein